jgi:hypothetical protein
LCIACSAARCLGNISAKNCSVSLDMMTSGTVELLSI